MYTIKSRNSVYNCFNDYLNKFENLTAKKIKKLRCDNGREYINKNMENLETEKGIIMEPCPPYVHELNGTDERYNRTIMDSASCLMKDLNLDRKYWPEVVKVASYLRNRIIANTVEKKTLYEIFSGKKPNITGCAI